MPKQRVQKFYPPRTGGVGFRGTLRVLGLAFWHTYPTLELSPPQFRGDRFRSPEGYVQIGIPRSAEGYLQLDLTNAGKCDIIY